MNNKLMQNYNKIWNSEKKQQLKTIHMIMNGSNYLKIFYILIQNLIENYYQKYHIKNNYVT